MCRHLAYLGPPATLRSVLIDPPHGLYRQAWAPRRQRHGTVNADGFGVGWYAPATRTRPGTGARCRSGGTSPSPTSPRVTRAGAMLAAVRYATAGTDPGAAAVAPYASGRWLFSHNGVLDGWPAVRRRAGRDAARRMRCSGWRPGSTRRCCGRWCGTGSSRGLAPAEALADTVAALRRRGVTGRFNFLLTDGQVIAATAAGDTLWYRRPRGGRGRRLRARRRRARLDRGPRTAPSSPRRRSRSAWLSSPSQPRRHEQIDTEDGRIAIR